MTASLRRIRRKAELVVRRIKEASENEYRMVVVTSLAIMTSIVIIVLVIHYRATYVVACLGAS